MCQSMVNIQFPTAEIRRGKKRKRRKKKKKQDETRMWANAQPDGRPAEYRWRPLLTPTNKVPRGNSAKTRYPLKCDGVPQTRKSLSAVSGWKFTILWGHVEEVSVFNKFLFRLSICAFVAKI